MEFRKYRSIYAMNMLPLFFSLSQFFVSEAFAADDTKDEQIKEKELAESDPPAPVQDGFGIELIFVPQEFLDLVEASGLDYDYIRRNTYLKLYKDLDRMLVRARNLWIEKIHKECSEMNACTVNILVNKGARVTFNDGFWYEIKLDIGAVEITTEPLPYNEWK
ncbi:MAG: hypothetical protein ACREGC_03875, partial [Minisyncoccia bacterium]